MARLFLYDTSNFVDYPIGGQLTSIHNFLHYVSDCAPERMRDIVLVGITLKEREVGVMQRIPMFGQYVRFFPVFLGERDQNHTSRSVRLQYVKGLLRYIRRLKMRPEDCNYIHTPEAFGPLKLLCPRAGYVAFSHCNYFDMAKSFRFYQDRKWVLRGFDRYLMWMVRRLDLIFVLNRESARAYAKYHARMARARNSIVRPETMPERKESGHRILFVGRISLNKGIEGIIQAVRGLSGAYTLTIVGEGEEYERLIRHADDRIRFTGALTPAEAHRRMLEADILVMNSEYEGLPMTILEAQSFGVPVVTTDVGGIGEAVHYGKDAERTDGTPASIRAAIGRIEADYAAYAKAAYENAGRFDYRSVNRAIYRKLCEYWR